MADQWYVSRNNKKHGPFTAAKLKELAAQGRLLPTDLLLKPGMQKWVPAKSMKGLFPATAAHPALPATPLAPNGSADFQFNNDELGGKPSLKTTRQASSGKRLLIFGAAGGGVLLVASLVVVLMVVMAQRSPPTGSAGVDDRSGKTPLAFGGGDAGAGGKRWRISVTKGMAIWSVAYSPDGNQLATAGADGGVRIWNADTGEERTSLSGHEKDAKSVAFSPDGNWLASVAWDDTLRIWKPSEGQNHLTIKKTFAGYTQGWSVAASPDSTRFATGYFDLRKSKPVLRIWDVKSGKEVLDCVPTKRHEPHSIAYSKDGKYLASCCPVSRDNIGYNDGEVKIWNAATGNEEQTISVSGTNTNAVAFSPDGKYLAVGCGRWDSKSQSFAGCEIHVFALTTKAEPQVLRGHSFSVNSLAFNNGGTMLVSGAGRTFTLDTPGEVKVWSMPEGKELRSLVGHTNAVTSVAFSPDGKFIVSASGAYRNVNGKTLDSVGEVKLWDAKTGEDLGTLAVEKGSSSAPTPDTTTADTAFDHAANTKAALKKKIIEVSYVHAVQPVTKTFEAMCKSQRFKAVIGNPDDGDTSAGKNKLWTYRCSDGEITFRVHVLGNSAIQIMKIEDE